MSSFASRAREEIAQRSIQKDCCVRAAAYGIACFAKYFDAKGLVVQTEQKETVNDNEYTFTMPKGKVSVDATFVQKDAADDNSAAEKSKVIKLQIGSRIVNVDNEAVIYDAAPVIRNDRTLVPIRIVTETLGGKVDWNGVTKEVTLNIDGKEIKMTIGKTLEKYGVAPVIIDGRTFVPVRFVADELGATVAWDDATKTVTIAKIEK